MAPRKKKNEKSELKKGKKSAAHEAKDTLNEVLKEKYKKNVIVAASDVTTTFDIRLPTGIPSLDLALEGGIPRGIIAEIAGPDATGKTALCYQICGTYQKMREKKAGVLLCPIEGDVDKPFARKLGFQIPLSKIELARMEFRLGRKLTDEEKVEYSNEMGRVGYVDLDSADKMLQTVLDMTKLDAFGVVMIDSVAAMLAEDDITKKGPGGSETEVKVGDEAPYARSINSVIGSFLKRFLQARKAEPNGKKNLTTVLVVNQVRADMKGGMPWRVPGAFSLKHYKRVDIWLDNGTWIKNTDKEVIGHMVRWNIAKGQYGVHEHAKGAVPFMYRTGFDIVADLFETLHENDLLEHTGGGNWVLSNNHGEILREFDKSAGGKDGILELFRNDESVRADGYQAYNSLFTIPPLYEGWDE